MIAKLGLNNRGIVAFGGAVATFSNGTGLLELPLLGGLVQFGNFVVATSDCLLAGFSSSTRGSGTRIAEVEGGIENSGR